MLSHLFFILSFGCLLPKAFKTTVCCSLLSIVHHTCMNLLGDFYFRYITENIIMCRDLKAENVLLGADGAWKLCDFGSVSTNHKCFDKPEEMGIEEDNIRKHTTPAYRAPEVY